MEEFEYIIRTDLAVQKKVLKNTKSYKLGNITVKKFYSKSFNYVNIIFDNIEFDETKKDIKKIIIKELQRYLFKYKLNRDDSLLGVGLGNRRVASDSLGSLVIDNVLATGYVSDLNINSKLRPVYTFIPGIIKNTGYESFRSVKALVKELKPDFLIVVDSLISGSVDYLNKLIQITDEGIIPGSGISNYQEEISFKTLGVPVIVIGVPTATFASTIIRDALNKKEDTIKYKTGYDLVVSSKDIDYFVNDISVLIGKAINETFNNFNIF